jgi:hypothetical protein
VSEHTSDESTPIGWAFTGEAVEYFLGVLVDQRVDADLVLKLGQLRLRGQFAVDEQVGDLQEGRLFGELFDGVAPVAENAQFAVEERNGAFGGAGVLVPLVERDQPGFVAEVVDVNGRFIFAANHERQLDRLAVYA